MRLAAIPLRAKGMEGNNVSGLLPLAGPAVLQRLRHKIFVMSGKGGVGKSSVSVNLAAALAEMGYKTGLLDIDLHGPSVPGLLGLRGAQVRVEKGRFLPLPVAENLWALSLESLLQDKDHAVIWRGPRKNGAIRRMLGETSWGDLDFFLVDSPPGTGDEHLALLKMLPDAFCLVVTTSHSLALADVRKAVSFLRSMRVHSVGLVENMSPSLCPHCGGALELNQPGRALELACETGIAFLGAIPFDVEASRAADAGRTILAIPGMNPAKSAYYALAESVKKVCAG